MLVDEQPRVSYKGVGVNAPTLCIYNNISSYKKQPYMVDNYRKVFTLVIHIVFLSSIK